MIRLLLFLFGKDYKDYEPCHTCQILQEQLDYERITNKELIAAMVGLVKPEPIVIQPPEVLHPVHTVGLWSKRRAELEKRERVEASIKKDKSNPFAAKLDEVKKEEPAPVVTIKDDSINKLEEELGLNDAAETATESAAEQNTAS